MINRTCAPARSASRCTSQIQFGDPLSRKRPKGPQRRVIGNLEKEAVEAMAAIGLALGHPLRVQILLLLLKEPGSATTISHRLHIPLGNVSYHLKDVLDRKCKVVAKVRARQVRGALETFYRVDSAAFTRLFKPLQELPAILQAAAQGAAFVAFFNNAIEAVEYTAEGGELRQGVTAWRPGPVDQEGWDEINAALGKAQAQITKVVEDSAGRLARSAGAEINGVFGVGAFEVPPPSGAA